MSTVIRAALFQTAWTGDKESMIQVHEQAVRDAAAQGAQVLCFQELFYGPYFCQVQDKAFYEYAEAIPDGPIVKRFQALAKEHGIVLVLPMYEEEQPGVLYNTAAVIDADGSYLGKYRKHHIPKSPDSGRSSTSARATAAGRSSTPRSAGSASTSATTATSPRAGAPWVSLNAEIVFNPSATSRGLSAYLWQLEQPAAAAANEYFVGAINRVGVEELGDNDFYGTTYFVDPEAQFVGEVASDKEPELVVRDLDLAKLREVRDRWQFYRDRRPDAYGPLTAP